MARCLRDQSRRQLTPRRRGLALAAPMHG